MDLNNKDCLDKEKTKIELQVCWSPVRRKTKYSCSLDSFNGSACGSVDGITESLGNSNSSNLVSAGPAEDLKEQDLIRSLMKSFKCPLYSTFVRFCPDVDCTLSLGMPHPLPTPDEQRCMDMFKKTSMEEVIEVMKSTLFPPKIKCSELESSSVLFGGLYNIPSSSTCWGTATYAPTTSTTISGSMYRDSQEDVQTHTNNGEGFVSKLAVNKPKKASHINPVNNDNGSPMSNITSDEAIRWCSTCHTTATPLWRSGPMGAKSLCNACGIRYKKKERRNASTMVAVGENNKLQSVCNGTRFKPHCRS